MHRISYLVGLFISLLGRLVPSTTATDTAWADRVYTPEFRKFLEKRILQRVRCNMVVTDYDSIAIEWIRESESSPYQDDLDFRQAKELLIKNGLCAGGVGQRA